MKDTDLEIKGSGDYSGGTYHNVIIKGEGKFNGDLNCISLEIQGRCEVKGSLKAETVKVKGHHSVKGSLEALKIEIQGETDIDEDLSVDEAVIHGMVRVNGNCSAETFKMEGAFTIRGLLNTGELELTLHGPSEAREIGGDKITVKRKGKPQFTRLKKMIIPSGFNTGLTTDLIEGDEIYLEYTKAKIISGKELELRIGQLVGNKFRILIRNTEDPEKDAQTADDVLTQLEERGVPNYYGWQRFGKNRPNTHVVGRFLVQNDLKGAVDAYIGNPYPLEAKHIRDVRGFYDSGMLQKAYESMPSSMRYEKMMLRELIKEKKKIGELNEESYKKALLSLPKPLSRMFVHAYQSFLFNRVVSERIKLGIDKYVEGDVFIDDEEHLIHEFDENQIQDEIKNFKAHPTAPLFGSKVPLAGGAVGEMERWILAKEKLELEDFQVPKMPKLGSHGLRRSIRFKIWDTNVEKTKEGILVEFSITKGSYATAVLREIMKIDVY